MSVPGVSPLLSTKLFRPRLPAGHVDRERLAGLLEQGEGLPLTLVSAPAGFGKSTWVSHWMEVTDVPNAWVSLDSGDNDPRVFFSYLIAAIRTIHAEALGGFEELLSIEPLPETNVLAARWCNELAELDSKVLLALDDFHLIHDATILDVLDFHLRQSLPNLSLILLTRRDPKLSLAKLRARGELIDCRMADLRFQEGEANRVIAGSLGSAIDEELCETIRTVAEGWPVALRLALGVVREGRGVEALEGQVHRLSEEFLIQEVLSLQSPEARLWLQKVSILDRFSRSLAEAVGGPEPGLERGGATEDFYAWLIRSGIPLIALDSEGRWYRFHHLVSKILQRDLSQGIESCEPGRLHERAARWLEKNGFLDESLGHWLQSGDGSQAGSFVLRHRRYLVDREEFHRLRRWRRQLPRETREGDGELLMLKAWDCDHFGLFGEYTRLREILGDRIRAIPEAHRRARTLAEFNCIEGGWSVVLGDAREALSKVSEGLEGLPPEFRYERGYALMVLAVSHAMLGEFSEAFEILNRELEGDDAENEETRGRLLTTRCRVQTMAADRAGLERTARSILDYPWNRRLPETRARALFSLGHALFERNELSEARKALETVVEDEATPNLLNQLRATYALASIHQAQGLVQAANQLLDTATSRLHRLGNATFLSEITYFRAEMALRQGQPKKALAQIDGIRCESLLPGFAFFRPELTLAKIHLSQGTKRSTELASNQIDHEIGELERTHSRRFLMEAWALKALAASRLGREEESREALARALDIGIPGPFIRAFVDLGPSMLEALQALPVEGEQQIFIEEVRRASLPGSRAQDLVEPLTPRELQVLLLIAEHLSNPEIADRLRIATATVKRHINNIFGKLDVGDRRRAVVKARELGLLAA